MIEVQTGYLESIAADIEILVNQFDEFFAQQSLGDLKDLESDREKGGKKSTVLPKGEKKDGFFKSLMNWIDDFKTRFLLYLTAGIAALTLSNFGFTGFFEKKIPEIISKVKNFFGGEKGIFTKISQAITNLKTMIAEKIPKFPGGGKIVGMIQDMAKPLVDFFKNVGSKLGGFLRVVGKILYPLAVLMSAFDGFKAAVKESEEGGNVVDVISSFIGNFFGSFIGEFINLIKTVLLWPFKAFLADEEGNFDTSTMLGSFLDTIDKFDFNKLIQNIIESVLKPISMLWTGVKSLANSLGADFEMGEGDKENIKSNNKTAIKSIDGQIEQLEKDLESDSPFKKIGRASTQKKIDQLKIKRRALEQENIELTTTAVSNVSNTSRIDQTQTLANQTQEFKNNSSATGNVNVVAPNTVNNTSNSSSATIMESPSAEDGLTRAYA